MLIAVLGAGTMGAGIASTAAVSGLAVRLYDAAPGGAQRGRGAIRARLERLRKTGRGIYAYDEDGVRIPGSAAWPPAT